MKKKKWVTALLLLAAIWFISLLTASISVSNEATVYGNVAVIPVTGVIVNADENAFFEEAIAQADDIITHLEDAEQKKNIKLIVLEINSPGGTPVASAEIAEAVKRSNKTTVAWIREAGASGAYWIASATDHIIAHPVSITGSIAVKAEHIDLSGFLADHNIYHTDLSSGKFKNTGNPLTELSQEEKELLTKKIERLHEYFIEQVAENRNMPLSRIRSLATGEFYLGIEAIELGLVDELGSKAEVEKYIESNIKTKPVFQRFEKEKGFLDILTSTKQGYAIGRGIGASLKETIKVRT